MGEYARRISDGCEVKIGTCEEMLYLRFEDRSKVSHIPGNVDVNDRRVAGELLFRLPFPDEDDILPGDYDDPFRYQRMYDAQGNDFTRDSLLSQPGTMQLTHKSGLLLNVPCYHGMKLPEVTPPMRAFWNGKSWAFELAMLRAIYRNGSLALFPVIICRFCRKMWRVDWSDVFDYIPEPLRERLAKYAQAVDRAGFQGVPVGESPAFAKETVVQGPQEGCWN